MKQTFTAALVLLLVFGILGVTAASAADPLLAFPGAEGGGKYTQGARAGDSVSVYHVTNLNAKGAGSFADAVSKPNRIIVFDVGGTIELSSTLSISKSNLTILGQTAPGDGITLAGGDILLSSGTSNIVMRYLRIRPSDKNGGEPDGLGGRWNHNIILDHCSVSWSVDEGLTLYAGSSETNPSVSTNMTMQYCLGAESLRMSNHFKGAHGYGAIWGGTQATYHHNLLAHHDSRSPRLDRELASTDARNNVIYDWGQTNSAYGAEPYSYHNQTQNPSNLNWVNNYYKYGPGTGSKIRSRIFDISNPLSVKPYSNFYFAGNYMYGSSDVTSNNWSGINNTAQANKLSEPVSMGAFELPVQTAEEAYEDVLANAGATLPRRDSIDARIVADVKNQTGRIVNKAEEVGGFVAFEETHRVFEIPQAWKTANGMEDHLETDIVKNGSKWDGYTWIEAYVNDWTAQQAAPTNPQVTVLSPAISSVSGQVNGQAVDKGAWAVITDIEALTYRAVTTPVGGAAITRMELYDGSNLLKRYEGASEINDAAVSLDAGVHYLTCRAYNEKGESVTSPTSIVYVNGAGGAGSWDYAQIGTPSAFSGKGAASLNQKTGTYTVSGSGKIGVSSDKCGFMYQKVSGDFELTARMDEIPKYENGVLAGLMLRESLEAKSRMLFLGDGWLKYGENIQLRQRTSTGGSASSGWMKNSSGKEISNTDSYDTSKTEYRMPKYMKMKRTGDTVTLSVSDDGVTWTNNPRQPYHAVFSGLPEEIYVGIAVDSAQGTAAKEYFTMATFGALTLDGKSDIEDQTYQIPFCDESYVVPPWFFSNSKVVDKDMAADPYPKSGAQKKDSGHVLVVNTSGGYAYRRFDQTDSGINEVSFDFLTKGKSDGDSMRMQFADRNPLESGSQVICEILAVQDGYFEYTNASGAASGTAIGVDTLGTIHADLWYRVRIRFDYSARDAGTADWVSVTIVPYENYGAGTLDERKTGAARIMPITNAPLGCMKFTWLSGGAKYVSEVALQTDRKPSPSPSPSVSPSPTPSPEPTQAPVPGKIHLSGTTALFGAQTVVKGELVNDTKERQEGWLVVAVYDGDMLAEPVLQFFELEPGNSLPFEQSGMKSGNCAKIMVWNRETLAPMADMKEFQNQPDSKE